MKSLYSNAIFSDDRKYRYALARVWDDTKNYVVWIGLNPSTADETRDDPTIRRCINYAKDWGYGGIVMLNIFAYRSTNPKELYKVENPVDELSDIYFGLHSATENAIVVAAWGNHGEFLNRGEEVKKLIPNLYVLGLTKNGNPKHPLYLKKNLKPIIWKK